MRKLLTTIFGVIGALGLFDAALSFWTTLPWVTIGLGLGALGMFALSLGKE